MRRSSLLTLLIALLLAPGALHAQKDTLLPATAATPVRTFYLRALTPGQAGKLIAPYVQGPNSGVFGAGTGRRAITVRGSKSVLALVDSVLKANDRRPASVTLQFRLIAAEDTPTHDPAVADVEQALHGLFRFRGYRLLAQGAAVVGEDKVFGLTLAAPSEPRGMNVFTVNGSVGDLILDGTSRSVELDVHLTGPTVRSGAGGVHRSAEFSTGLTVPMGQTVVLGSAAASGQAHTLILAVRADTTGRTR